MGSLADLAEAVMAALDMVFVGFEGSVGWAIYPLCAGETCSDCTPYNSYLTLCFLQCVLPRRGNSQLSDSCMPRKILYNNQ